MTHGSDSSSSGTVGAEGGREGNVLDGQGFFCLFFQINSRLKVYDCAQI